MEELLKKAKNCKSVEELQKLAAEIGLELTQELAKEVFAKLKTAQNGELDDDALGNVAGGFNIAGMLGGLGDALGAQLSDLKDDMATHCPACKKTNVVNMGTAAGKIRYRCNDCGHEFIANNKSLSI